MTTIEDVRNAAYARFRTLWVVGSNPRTPFIRENEKEDALANGDVDWARISVREVGGAQESQGEKGSRKYRRVASIFVELYTRTNRSGMGPASRLAHEARTIFEGESFGGVDCNSAAVRDTGPDGKWQRTLVETDARYTETK